MPTNANHFSNCVANDINEVATSERQSVSNTRWLKQCCTSIVQLKKVVAHEHFLFQYQIDIVGAESGGSIVVFEHRYHMLATR